MGEQGSVRERSEAEAIHDSRWEACVELLMGLMDRSSRLTEGARDGGESRRECEKWLFAAVGGCPEDACAASCRGAVESEGDKVCHVPIWVRYLDAKRNLFCRFSSRSWHGTKPGLSLPRENVRRVFCAECAVCETSLRLDLS